MSTKTRERGKSSLSNFIIKVACPLLILADWTLAQNGEIPFKIDPLK